MNAAAVVVERLSYTFAGRNQPSLREVSLALDEGSWTLVTGDTGSGKTTLLRALGGWIPRHAAGTMQGQVVLWGHDTSRELPAGLVGHLLQSADDQCIASTVRGEIAFGLENLALDVAEIESRIDEALRRFELVELVDRPTAELSGGQKQRVLLAAMLALRPRLLLLDEPLSQLDALSGIKLLDDLARLRDEGLTIAMVEHRVEEALPYVDQVAVVARGRVSRPVARENFHMPARTPRRAVAGAIPLMAAFEFGPTSFRYDHSPVHVWQDVQFTIHQGDFVALVGPNGSGKSTLLDECARTIVKEDSARAQSHVGLVLQNPDLMLFSPSVFDELAFAPRRLNAPRDDIAARVSTTAACLDIENVLDEPPHALSQGQRLRVAVAATLTSQPRVLLLDEPTTGQDRQQVERMLDLLAAMLADGACGIQTVLFSTHDLPLAARYANRVLVLADGRLAADTTPEHLAGDAQLSRIAHLRSEPRP